MVGYQQAILNSGDTMTHVGIQFIHSYCYYHHKDISQQEFVSQHLIAMKYIFITVV